MMNPTALDSHRGNPPDHATKPAGASHSREGTILALLAFIIYGLVCSYLVFGLHYYAGDAQSRVANAYYVLFSQNPHLGAIGFIWNPLPSLLELPIVALHPWIPAVVTRGIAGDVVSGLLGATAVYHLHHILDRWSLNRFWRILITLCFALNPLIVLYGSNGMSDIMWVACILGTYSGVFDYLDSGSLRRLVSGALWLVAGFGMRYEAVPFGALLIVAVLWTQWNKPRAQRTGSAILLGAPLVFGAGVWLYFNWLIMKNPLYFLNSSYGNLAQTSTGAYMTPAMARAHHHILGSLLYVLHFGLFYWPIFIGFLAAIWWSVGRHRDPRAIVLILGTIGAELLELVFAYQGHLGEWDRYFLEFIPNGILLSALAIRKADSLTSHWSKALTGLLTAVLAVVVVSGSVGTVVALQNPTLGHPDGTTITAAIQGKPLNQDPFTHQAAVVRYINTHPRMTILADTFEGWPIIIRAKHPQQFIITSDYNFSAILHNPRGRVTAFMVPQPYQVAKLDAINRAWPGLWAGSVPWTHLIKSFPGGNRWRLYEILPSAP